MIASLPDAGLNSSRAIVSTPIWPLAGLDPRFWDSWDGCTRNGFRWNEARREQQMTGWDPAAFTKTLIADLREHGGRATSGPMAGRPLLILTTTGARTGEPRVVVVTYTRDGDAYVVAGSKSGAPTDPFWFRNLVANPVVTLEAEGKRTEAQATVAEGADRDKLWARHSRRGRSSLSILRRRPGG